jgi:hypothetical protein
MLVSSWWSICGDSSGSSRGCSSRSSLLTGVGTSRYSSTAAVLLAPEAELAMLAVVAATVV